MDPNLRSAVSIARRLQDPLVELVKIEPKHIGVGMYQASLLTKKKKIQAGYANQKKKKKIANF